MPLPPCPDWLIFLWLIVPGNEIIVSNQFILQPCAFIGNVLFHHQRLHPHNIDFCGFALATLINISSTASVYRPAAINLLRNRLSPLNDKPPFLPVQFHMVFLLHTLFLL